MSKILLMNAISFGYQKYLESELMRPGNEVIDIDFPQLLPKEERNFLDNFCRFVSHDLKIFKGLYEARRERYYNKKFKEKMDLLRESEVLIVTVPYNLNIYYLEKIKREIPTLKVVALYLDSIATSKEINYVESTKNLYDLTISFDKYESEKFNLIYIPSFYIDIFNYTGEEKDIDIFFVGVLALRWERLKMCVDTLRFCKMNGLNGYLKLLLPSDKKHPFYEKIEKEILNGQISRDELDEITLKCSLTVEECATLMKRSKVAIEIIKEHQTAPTLRTFEALASETKLITNNEYIKDFDFYNEKNIKIIENDKCVLEKSFFTEKYERYDTIAVEKYSINSYINHVFKRVRNL